MPVANVKQDRAAAGHPSWGVIGDWVETCNCDSVCPCHLSSMKDPPTYGTCQTAHMFRVDHGHYGDVGFGGLYVAIVLHFPGPMADGNMVYGLILDERATDPQRHALEQIFSGKAGGPMAALIDLSKEYRGTVTGAFAWEQTDDRWTVSVPGLLDQTVEAYPSPNGPGDRIILGEIFHPMSASVGVGIARRNRVSAFGFDWDFATGKRDGVFAQFNWQAKAQA